MSAPWLVHGKAGKYLSRPQPEVADFQQLVQKLFSCIEFISVCECECNLVIRYNIWVVVVVVFGFFCISKFSFCLKFHFGGCLSL